MLSSRLSSAVEDARKSVTASGACCICLECRGNRPQVCLCGGPVSKSRVNDQQILLIEVFAGLSIAVEALFANLSKFLYIGSLCAVLLSSVTRAFRIVC